MFLNLSSLPLFKFIKFSSLLLPSHRCTISPSHRHTITSLHLFKLAVTELPLICSSSPSRRHLTFATARLHFNRVRNDIGCYIEGRKKRGERINKKMREDEEEDGKNRGFRRRRWTNGLSVTMWKNICGRITIVGLSV